jgi:hypothetical protein
MFKSSFAREILEETRHNAGAASSLEAKILMPAVRHSRYRSTFAASTHSVLDNLREDGGGVSGHEEDEDDEASDMLPRYASDLRAYSGTTSSRQVFFLKSFYLFQYRGQLDISPDPIALDNFKSARMEKHARQGLALDTHLR